MWTNIRVARTPTRPLVPFTCGRAPHSWRYSDGGATIEWALGSYMIAPICANSLRIWCPIRERDRWMASPWSRVARPRERWPPPRPAWAPRPRRANAIPGRRPAPASLATRGRRHGGVACGAHPLPTGHCYCLLVAASTGNSGSMPPLLPAKARVRAARRRGEPSDPRPRSRGADN